MIVLDALAAYRLTKLATDDVLTQPARDRLVETAYLLAGRSEQQRWDFLARRRQLSLEEGDWQQIVEEDDHPPKLATLVTCRWCAGYWIAFGVVLARRFGWWRFVRDASALSAAAALLARLEDG